MRNRKESVTLAVVLFGTVRYRTIRINFSQLLNWPSLWIRIQNLIDIKLETRVWIRMGIKTLPIRNTDYRYDTYGHLLTTVCYRIWCTSRSRSWTRKSRRRASPRSWRSGSSRGGAHSRTETTLPGISSYQPVMQILHSHKYRYPVLRIHDILV